MRHVASVSSNFAMERAPSMGSFVGLDKVPSVGSLSAYGLDTPRMSELVGAAQASSAPPPLAMHSSVYAQAAPASQQTLSSSFLPYDTYGSQMQHLQHPHAQQQLHLANQQQTQQQQLQQQQQHQQQQQQQHGLVGAGQMFNVPSLGHVGSMNQISSMPRISSLQTLKNVTSIDRFPRAPSFSNMTRDVDPMSSSSNLLALLNDSPYMGATLPSSGGSGMLNVDQLRFSSSFMSLGNVGPRAQQMMPRSAFQSTPPGQTYSVGTLAPHQSVGGNWDWAANSNVPVIERSGNVVASGLHKDGSGLFAELPVGASPDDRIEATGSRSSHLHPHASEADRLRRAGKDATSTPQADSGGSDAILSLFSRLRTQNRQLEELRARQSDDSDAERKKRVKARDPRNGKFAPMQRSGVVAESLAKKPGRRRHQRLLEGMKVQMRLLLSKAQTVNLLTELLGREQRALAATQDTLREENRIYVHQLSILNSVNSTKRRSVAPRDRRG